MNTIVDERIEAAYHEGYKKGYIDASDSYRKLAKQVPKRGTWKYNIGGTCTCSECGFSPSLMAYNFCPVCGADMRGEEA